MIILVSTPRSGSTLTYQILARGTKSTVLTNLWNMLYSVPLIGGLLSKKRVNVQFKSDRGFVKGLYGEAEGLKFWEYWTGQGLEEKTEVNDKRIKYIKKILGRLINKKKPFITAFLGHSFSINKLRKDFPGAIFIYLKRDKLSNIYSMYKTGRKFDWFSLKPMKWENAINLNKYERVIWQQEKIIEKIELEISEKDTLIVNYEDICNNPKGFLRKVKAFSAKHDIELQLQLENIPESFIANKISPETDLDSKKINDLLC